MCKMCKLKKLILENLNNLRLLFHDLISIQKNSYRLGIIKKEKTKKMIQTPLNENFIDEIWADGQCTT